MLLNDLFDQKIGNEALKLKKRFKITFKLHFRITVTFINQSFVYLRKHKKNRNKKRTHIYNLTAGDSE